jgi:hypothetical protein
MRELSGKVDLGAAGRGDGGKKAGVDIALDGDLHGAVRGHPVGNELLHAGYRAGEPRHRGLCGQGAHRE